MKPPRSFLASARRAQRATAGGRRVAGMREFAFTITREGATTKPAGPRRPQTPQPPFPYQSADITFKNETAAQFSGLRSPRPARHRGW